MNKTTINLALLASVVTFGGCSTYNHYAPDWAKIGSSGTGLKQAVTPLKMNLLGGTLFLGRLDLVVMTYTNQNFSSFVVNFWPHLLAQTGYITAKTCHFFDKS